MAKGKLSRLREDSKYTEGSVLKDLKRKLDFTVNEGSKLITLERRANDLGIRSWGKIDYLKLLGYRVSYSSMVSM